MDKYILSNNKITMCIKITGDKPGQQLFPKQVATQLPLRNKINWTHRSVKIKRLKN